MRSRSPILAAPEEAPEFARRVSISWWQAAGLALLLAVPILALCGFLGDKNATQEAAAEGVRVRIESPACARYGNLCQLQIQVDADPALADRVVRIEVALDYLKRFSAVTSRPAETRAERGSLILEQTVDADGRGTPWVFDLTPERYGWTRGSVRVTHGDDAPLTLELASFVFP